MNLWTVGCADPRKLHSTPQQDRMNLISGKGETNSRLPGPFSLFLPGSCPNNRNRCTTRFRTAPAPYHLLILKRPSPKQHFEPPDPRA